MIAATSRIWFSPAVKADLVSRPTAGRAWAGSLAMTLPTCPDFTADAI